MRSSENRKGKSVQKIEPNKNIVCSHNLELGLGTLGFKEDRGGKQGRDGMD
jgi:peptidyl-tRNA hydrolase